MQFCLHSLKTIRRRRTELGEEFDISKTFRELEESCIPSYCHRNPLAAAVAWWRLVSACALYRATEARPPVLDFGAATGELFDLLATHGDYHFVESNDTLARALARRIPLAKREERTALPHAHFGTVFALDSLEHNDDAPRILDELVASLRIGGHLIVSGPTENRLYRLGRRIAGFQGHYHRANIYQLEGAIRERFEFVRLRAIPAGIPLFRVSVWKRAEP